MTTPRNILVPIDLGHHAKEVLDYAAALAGKLDHAYDRIQRCHVWIDLPHRHRRRGDVKHHAA